MSKGLKGFLIGMFVLVVGFFVGVSIAGEVQGHGGFIGEIESWQNKSQQEEQLPDDGNQEAELKITDNSIVIR